ncbi:MULTISPECIES: GLPGLI family protein [Segatella]|jgi:GLPGLI family protein|uniref:GLPGLI family protein n=2 Tax=Segatella TaxID=2974251 RepID=D8DZR7_9BACT|nr:MULTISPECIES: GLPGLI family protein [Segatella]EFI71152.1 conserved hypothetical protein [Segatella baroniae B14]UKK78290.1 GLPGLI family protein [Segatella baroniae B14]
METIRKRNIMRKGLIILIYCFIALKGIATNEKASYECIYRLTYQVDTIQKRYSEALMSLRVAENQSFFFSQSGYERDSSTLNIENFSEWKAITDSIKRKYGKINSAYYILKNYQKNNLEYIINKYKYTENIPDFKWHYTNEKKKIGEHECQKATCAYMGRNYEVWFTPDIPISDGPWKFCGLPGLILEAYDTQHHYEFNFLGMNKCDVEIFVPVVNCTKTTKKKVIELTQKRIDDPNAFMKLLSAKTGIKGKTKFPKKFSYATMERLEAFPK